MSEQGFDEKIVWCFAHGREGDWEALCLDFDIGVQGQSLDEVKALLREAICTYIEDALAEQSPAVRHRLLTRRAPFWTRVQSVAPFLLHALFRHKDGGRELQAGFELPCPA